MQRVVTFQRIFYAFYVNSQRLHMRQLSMIVNKSTIYHSFSIALVGIPRDDEIGCWKVSTCRTYLEHSQEIISATMLFLIFIWLHICVVESFYILVASLAKRSENNARRTKKNYYLFFEWLQKWNLPLAGLSCQASLFSTAIPLSMARQTNGFSVAHYQHQILRKFCLILQILKHLPIPIFSTS